MVPRSVPHRRTALPLAFGVLLASFFVGLAPSPAAAAEADPSRVLQLASDDGLRAQGMDFTLQQIDFFGRDGSHETVRWIQKEFRWVRADSRRGGGVDLTLLLDDAWSVGPEASVDRETFERAGSRAAQTWRADSCLSKNPLRSALHPGGDVTIFDYLMGAGELGDPFAADIVVGGFAPGMEELYGDDILAFAVTFVFVDADGQPTDADRDGYLDTAHSEIYLNPAVTWTTGGEGGVDLETALLHEMGHSLGLGHFGSPPESVMTPVYSGARRDLFPIDHAALCLVHGRKP